MVIWWSFLGYVSENKLPHHGNVRMNSWECHGNHIYSSVHREGMIQYIAGYILPPSKVAGNSKVFFEGFMGRSSGFMGTTGYRVPSGRHSSGFTNSSHYLIYWYPSILWRNQRQIHVSKAAAFEVHDLNYEEDKACYPLKRASSLLCLQGIDPQVMDKNRPTLETHQKSGFLLVSEKST